MHVTGWFENSLWTKQLIQNILKFIVLYSCYEFIIWIQIFSVVGCGEELASKWLLIQTLPFTVSLTLKQHPCGVDILSGDSIDKKLSCSQLISIRIMNLYVCQFIWCMNSRGKLMQWIHVFNFTCWSHYIMNSYYWLICMWINGA